MACSAPVALWREALALAPPDTTLVLNADDPSVAELATGWKGPLHLFGIDDATHAGPAGAASDARWCRSCGGSFAYELRFSAHLGHWRCPGCGRARPVPETVAGAVDLGADGATFTVAGLGVFVALVGLRTLRTEKPRRRRRSS